VCELGGLLEWEKCADLQVRQYKDSRELGEGDDGVGET